MSVAEIHAIVTRIDHSSAQGARDAALILLSFAPALRRSELAALDLADIAAKPAGLLCHHPQLQGRPRGPRPGLRGSPLSDPRPRRLAGWFVHGPSSRPGVWP